MTEQASTLTTFIVMEGEVPSPQIVQEASRENNDTMKVRVPFYVGDSFAHAPGFDKRIFWPAEMLPGIVQEMKKRIDEKKQPLTTYARHKHAMSGDYLPVGGIVDVVAEGRIGYVIEEVEPTAMGRDVQLLVKRGKLNAVSLRSGPGSFELSEKRVNQEDVYWPERFSVDGVDWAPDRPAMDTYGVTILHEAPNVESKPVIPKKEATVETITLEALRREHSSIVSEIEAPFKSQIGTLTQERDDARKKVKELEDKFVRQERDYELVRISQRFADPKAALVLLEKECEGVVTKEGIAAKVLPIVMEAQAKKAANTPAEKSPAQLLQEMLFPGSGNGRTLVQEGGDGKTVTAAADYSGETAAGLPVPE